MSVVSACSAFLPTFQRLHIGCDPGVQDAGVVLGGFQVAVPSILDTVSMGTPLDRVLAVAKVCRAS